ncbi:MAG: hypothetical protein ACI9KN_000455 [Gammaproteobacteria bacterium]|jgi:hypothetical protein
MYRQADPIQTSRPWHSYPYVWMMLSIPFSAVIMGVIMITLAIESSSGLVADDYYQKGKEINLVLARDEVAKSMGLVANLTLDAGTGKLLIDVTSTSDAALPNQLDLHFFHSTRAGNDQTRVLHRVDGLTYTTRIDELPAGRWDIQMSTDSWRLIGSLKIPGGDTSRLTPAIQ